MDIEKIKIADKLDMTKLVDAYRFAIYQGFPARLDSKIVEVEVGYEILTKSELLAIKDDLNAKIGQIDVRLAQIDELDKTPSLG